MSPPLHSISSCALEADLLRPALSLGRTCYAHLRSNRHGLPEAEDGAWHPQGFIWRDCKPENILMSEKSRGRIKLADFGLSIDATEERPVTRAGTLDYMAPEVGKKFLMITLSVGRSSACFLQQNIHVGRGLGRSALQEALSAGDLSQVLAQTLKSLLLLSEGLVQVHAVTQDRGVPYRW